MNSNKLHLDEYVIFNIKDRFLFFPLAKEHSARLNPALSESMPVKSLWVSRSFGIQLARLSLETVEPTQNHVDISHIKNKSYGKSVPRVYSEISYNISTLYGESNKNTSADTANHSFDYWTVDSAFSYLPKRALYFIVIHLCCCLCQR